MGRVGLGRVLMLPDLTRNIRVTRYDSTRNTSEYWMCFGSVWFGSGRVSGFSPSSFFFTLDHLMWRRLSTTHGWECHLPLQSVEISCSCRQENEKHTYGTILLSWKGSILYSSFIIAAVYFTSDCISSRCRCSASFSLASTSLTSLGMIVDCWCANTWSTQNQKPHCS